MPRWTLADIPFLLPDADVHVTLVFVDLSDSLTIVRQTLLCVLVQRFANYLLLNFLFSMRLLLHLWILLRRFINVLMRCSILMSSHLSRRLLRLQELIVLVLDAFQKDLHETLVVFQIDMKLEVKCCQNIQLAIYNCLQIKAESSWIVDVILETQPIFIYKKRFFIVFVCEKETGTVKSIKGNLNMKTKAYLMQLKELRTKTYLFDSFALLAFSTYLCTYTYAMIMHFSEHLRNEVTLIM